MLKNGWLRFLVNLLPQKEKLYFLLRITTQKLHDFLSSKKAQSQQPSLRLIRKPKSLDMRIGEDRDTELKDMLKCEGVSSESYVEGELLRENISKLLSELTPQEQEIIILRFGLTDGNELSLSQVGERLGLSRERIRQIQQRAFTKLRKQKYKMVSYLHN